LCSRQVVIIMAIHCTDSLSKPYTTVAARIAVDLDLFKHISSAGDNITSHELVSLTKADESLICKCTA
jgi:hypothetical protein